MLVAAPLGAADPVAGLSRDQERAFSLICDFIADGEDPMFVLHGLAGVGKTLLLGELALHHPEAFLAAPTGKAAAILREKFGLPARTVHSLFYVFQGEELDAFGKRRPRFSRRRADGSLRGQVLLLDEASMVSVAIRDDLLKLGLRIVAVGDPGQLPPVNAEPGFPRPDFLLTEIHRQARGSAILRQAGQVRAGGDYAADGPDFRVTGRGSLDQLVWCDVALCYTNATRHRLNQLARIARGVAGLTGRVLADESCFDPALDYPRAGEPVIVLKNSPKRDLWNGSIVKLAAAFRPGDGVALLNIAGDLVEVPDVRFVGVPSNIPEGREILSLDFAYCVTTHKSQGSEWPRVLVVDEFPEHDPQRGKWLYTALTRASESVLVLDKRRAARTTRAAPRTRENRPATLISRTISGEASTGRMLPPTVI